MTEPEPTETESRPQREALWQRVVVGALAALIATIGWLPTWLAYAVGDLVAVPWYLYWSLYDRRGRRSSGYWRNTMLAFREGAQLGPTRPERHLWRWSRHIAWIMVDFCRMRKITADNLPNVDISAKSKTGGRILSKARRLDGGADDMTWVAGYSLKFHS